MRIRESLYVMRRWRSLIFAGTLIGLVIGWVFAPGASVKATVFQATNTLIPDPTAVQGVPIYQAQVMVSRGAVPDRVARRLGLDSELVRSMVSAEVTPDMGVMHITARSTDPVQAESLANVSAEELIVELGGSRSPLHTLEPAVASPLETGDVRGPTSHRGRAVLFGGFGLLLGIGAGFAVDRFDNRIRTQGGVERALGIRVVAEVPAVPRSDRRRMLDTAKASTLTEAYRRLRTMVVGWASTAENGRSRRIIVVTAATGGEGTTSTVAHLAEALGEIGYSVVVVSADLRRPRLHLYFDKAREPGLSDVLRGAPDLRRITNLNLSTSVRGVRFVASGAPVRNPAPLLTQVGDHLHEAQSLGDIVLVDAPPLLTTSDGADLARHADGVLVVLRVGRTSVGAAARSVELLERLNIPVIGAVLMGSDGAALRPYPKRIKRPANGA